MEFQLQFQRSSSLWQSLPPEVMCMIADQYLDLEKSQNQDKCSEYPRAANADMTFAQVDRRARSAFIHALGKRSIMIEIQYNTALEERGSDFDQLVRELSLFLPTSRYQHSCNRQHFSVLHIDIGSRYPSKKTRPVYISIFPATEYNILQLSTFIQHHVLKLTTIAFLPQPIIKEHKNAMSKIIRNVSNLTRCLQKAGIAFPSEKPIVSNENEIAELRETTEQTKNSVRNATGLITLFQPYQTSLQHIINNNKMALRCLMPILTSILSVWDATIISNGRNINWSEQVQGMNTSNIIGNLTSITMRSVAEFLLTQPNTAKHSRHFALMPGKITIQKHRAHNKFAQNPAYRHLTDCISFANHEFVSMRDYFSLPPQAQLLPPLMLGQHLAIVQDEAHLELALARYKTIPGMMDRYAKLRCDCEDQEVCASMHTMPGEHLERAKRRVLLVREHSDRMERKEVEKGWIERWLGAFDAVVEKIERGLEGWKEGDEKGILEEPMDEFNDVEFVFQYAPENE